MDQLSLQDFACKCVWLEHMRLSNYIDDISATAHFRKTLSRMKRGEDCLLKNGKRTEWTAMVENWYRIAVGPI